MEKYLQKAWHYIQSLPVVEKGYNPELDAPDPRDYQFGEHFADDVFGAALPERYIPDPASLPKVPFQNSILSCVSATCSFINAYNSKQEGNDVFLSWRYLYASVQHYPGGTSVRENLDVLRRSGQCEDSLLPQMEYYLGENYLQNPNYLTQAMHDNAANYKIENYYFVNFRNEVEMKTAIMKAPVGATLYVGWTWYDPVVKWDGAKRYGHSIAIVGWDKNGWLIADWDGRGFKHLDFNYPFYSAYIVLDKSDKLKGELMKPYKLKGTNRLLVVLPNGKYQWVSSPAQWQALNEKKLLVGDTREITEDQLKALEVDESPVMIVK